MHRRLLQPRGGQVVPEINNADIREIFFGMYRIIYHESGNRIEILAVYHGARLLDDTDL